MTSRLRPRGTPTLLPDPPASELWCPIISGDDHVLEPGDLFARRLPGHLLERAPMLVEDEDGVPFWRVDGLYYPIVVANGSAGRPPGEWGNSAQKFEDFRPGVGDPTARVRDMDLNGVWASLCFPSLIWGFAGRRFSMMADAEVGFACLRAYNDWMLEDWCGAHPDRFVPCQLPWLADPEVAAAEIRRNADRGFRAVTFPETPDRLGFPSIYSGRWAPFFRACEETETVVNLHVGSSGLIARPSAESPLDVTVALFPVNGLMAMVDWLYARIPIDFPDIKITLSEAGVSWVPMMSERLARGYRHVESSDVWSASDPHPNDLVRRNFWFTSIEDPSAFKMLELIGEDRILLESDYPHQDSTWPETQVLIAKDLGHLPPDTVRKIAFGTAAALYRHPAPPAEWLDRSTVGAA
ncbi:amidohydrolase family protein [Pseudonocardia sp. GCM10023141]|uniref:amidohydrolase family protein n=1 Tax=Pseudonocardia sp. GCM10023141 TaxID=3252653 RepID=UPI0036D40F59